MASFKVTFNPDMSNIGTQLRRRIESVPDALQEFGTQQSAKMESYAKENRKWTDRTNAARAGLFGQCVRNGNVIEIVLAHSATDPKSGYAYPLVLEFGAPPRDDGHPGVAPRPILGPTLAAHQTETFEQSKRIVLSLVGGKLL